MDIKKKQTYSALPELTRLEGGYKELADILSIARVNKAREWI